MGYIYVWGHYGGGRHIDADWSPNYEDLYSPELDFRIFVWPVCFIFCFSFLGFSDAPTPSLCTLVDYWVLRVARAFTIGNPLGCRGSACVEVMTTLHGSAPSLWRRAEGCVPPGGTIASVRDLLKSTHFLLEPPWPCKLSRRSFD